MADQVITKEQIRNLILAEKLKPSDLFGAESLTSDPVVTGFVDAEKRSATAGEYAHRKRTEEGFDKTRQDLEKQLQARDTELASMRKEAAKLRVGDLFAKKRQERKLDERQAKFVETRLPKFDPQKPEEVEKEFDSFLDAQVDEYGKLKEVFGIEDAKGDDGKGKGTEPGKSKGASGLPPHLDPTKNPLIKTN